MREDDKTLKTGGNTSPPGTLSEALNRVDDIQIPEQFEILETLGQGGMGIVYKARNMFTRKVVAIKVLLSGADDLVLQRFQREAQAACALDHPNVVRTYDFGMAHGTPYIVMEYVQGETLDQRLKKYGASSVERAIPIFKQMCAGVAHAHSHRIVHRDLKPSNVMFNRDEAGVETAKVFDFGIAKVDLVMDSNLTQTGEIFGTPLYMSPEQLKGESVNARSDVYSLGAVMYQMLAGEPPHVGDTAFSTMLKKLNEPPKTFSQRRLTVPSAIEQMIFKCLEVDPALRFQNAADIVAELDRIEHSSTAQKAAQKFMGGYQSSVNTPSARTRTLKIVFAVIAVVVLIGIAIGAYVFSMSSDNDHKISDLMDRSDTAFTANDIDTAFSLAEQAKAIADKAPESIASNQRKATILERLVNCENKRHDPIQEIGFINQLIPVYAKFDSAGMLEEKLLGRRLNLIDTLTNSTLELMDFIAGDEQHRRPPAPPAVAHDYCVKACMNYQAAWDCLSPEAMPDSRVKIKLLERIKPFLTAVHGLHDAGDAEHYYAEIEKRLPEIPPNERGQILYYVGAYWGGLADEAKDPAEAAKALAQAESYYKRSLEANKDLPAWNIFTLSSQEGLVVTYVRMHKLDEAKKYLDQLLKMAREHKGEMVDPGHIRNIINIRSLYNGAAEAVGAPLAVPKKQAQQ